MKKIGKVVGLWVGLSCPLCAAPAVEKWRAGQMTLFPTIQAAINAAEAGDLIRIREGVYHETLVIHKKSGTLQAPIQLEGAKGEKVVIDGAWEDLQKKGNKRWRRVAPGAYETELPSTSSNLPWDRVTAASIGEEDSLIATYWFDAKLDSMQKGTGILRRGSTVRIKMQEGEDPNNVIIHIGRSDAVLKIKDVCHWKIHNLSFRHATFAGVYLVGHYYHHIQLDRLTVQSCFRGISTDEQTSGSEVQISHCRLVNKRPLNWPWDGYVDHGQAGDDRQGPQRTTGIMIKGGVRFEVHHCEIAGWWDGMKLTGTSVHAHHNLVHDIQDDMVELESDRSNDVRFFNNVGYDLFVGISVVNNQGGNIYVFRNQVTSTRANFTSKRPSKSVYGYTIKLGKGWGAVRKAENVKFFNNTFFSYRAAIWDARIVPLKQFEFVNNIFYTQHDPRNFVSEDTLTHTFENGCQWLSNLWNKQPTLHEPGIQRCELVFNRKPTQLSLILLPLLIQKGSCAHETGTSYPSVAWPGVDTTPIVGKIDIGAHEIDGNDAELANIGPQR